MSIGYPYTYGDSLSSSEARANFTISKGCSLAFGAGFMYCLFLPLSVHAADENVNAVANEVGKRALKRVSNATGCGAILAVCGKKGNSEVVQRAANIALDPKTAAAFLCGFTVAWCLKYAVFDN